MAIEFIECLSFSIEVGVRVEAYNCEEWGRGQARHINSAFLIFNIVNKHGELLTVPRVKGTTKVSFLSKLEGKSCTLRQAKQYHHIYQYYYC